MRAAAVLAIVLVMVTAAWGQVTRVPLDGRDSATQETNLGNLVADAVRTQAPQAQMAFVAASSLKQEVIPAGELSAARVAGLLVYPEDKITVLTLKGDQVRQALERSVSLEPLPNKGFLQVSGLVVWFDQGAPANSRVVRILLADGTPINPTGTYRVAMPAGLAKGGLGYFRVFTGAPKTDTDLTTLDALTRYLKDRSPVSPSVEGRIRKITAAR